MSGALAAQVLVEREGFRLDVELSVRAGEVLAVLGPNGAGKTTLLRALAGLVPLTAGAVVLAGETLDDPAAEVLVPPERRPVGVVFQDYRLFPHLTVRENVAFAPRAQGRGRRTSRELADGWLARLGLDVLADRRPGRLSGGQAQRVALARALAAEPRLLLLDEPLSALDAATRHHVRTELHGHLADFPGPVLLVTHDPLEAMVLADRLLVLEHGGVVQSGPPAQVARRPASPYVARLVGLNLWPGTLVEPGQSRVALDGGGEVVATLHEPVPSVAGARLLVAARPAALAVHTEAPHGSSPRNVWQGRVAGMELLHDRVRLTVDGPPDAVVDVTAAAVAELALRAGLQVWVSAKATEVDAYEA